MSLTIRMPPFDELALRWRDIEPLVRMATDRTAGCFEPVDALQLAMSGSWRLWIVEKTDGAFWPGNEDEIIAIATTEVRQFPRMRVCDIPLIAGREMAEWVEPLLEALKAHARQFECARLTASGRPGWLSVPMLKMQPYAAMTIDLLGDADAQ